MGPISRRRQSALLIAALLAAPAQGKPFFYAGVSLSSDLEVVAARYPHSTRQDSYIRLGPEDVHDHISGIEVSGTGHNRRVRVIFELQDATGQPQYPRCRAIEARIASTFGPPQEIRRFAEEASPRADRIWRSETEQLALLCFGGVGGVFLAEAVQITPR
jgi:hypothetical protein